MIPDLNKTMNDKTFKLNGKANTKSIIYIAIDMYEMRINNPDIKLVIKWDLQISFDSII